MRRSIVAIAFVISACSTGATSTPTAPSSTVTPSPTQATNPALVTLAGEGPSQSRTFHLDGGNYNAAWTGRDRDTPDAGCSNGLVLKQTDGSYSATITSDDVPGGTSASGTTLLDQVPAGSFVVDATSDCGWSVAVTRP